MAAYQSTDTDAVIRTSDAARIPNIPTNGDRIGYQVWLDAGNTPDPYVAPAPTAQYDRMDAISLKIAFNHENRIRVLEGKATITAAQFRAAVNAL
jgi:hypothetical protein